MGTCHLFDVTGGGIFYGVKFFCRHSVHDRSFQRRKGAIMIAPCHLFDVVSRPAMWAAAVKPSDKPSLR